VPAESPTSLVSSVHRTRYCISTGIPQSKEALFPAHMVGNCTSRHIYRICRRKHRTLVHGNYFDTVSVSRRKKNFTHREYYNLQAAVGYWIYNNLGIGIICSANRPASNSRTNFYSRSRRKQRGRSRHLGQSLDLVSFKLNSLTSSSFTWKQICELALADPTFCTPGAIDVIVGSDQLWSLYTGGRKYFGNDFPFALNTVFSLVYCRFLFCLRWYIDDTIAVTHHADLDIHRDGQHST